MNVFDKARVIIYRFHEKGLEVFLINTDADKDPDVWKLPQGSLKDKLSLVDPALIDLDPIEDKNGSCCPTYAIEADWHQIPSIRGLIKHDVKFVKRKIEETIPQVEKGAYFCVKEAIKKVLPNEYEALKELKDILLDRNTVTNI